MLVCQFCVKKLDGLIIRRMLVMLFLVYIYYTSNRSKHDFRQKLCLQCMCFLCCLITRIKKKKKEEKNALSCYDFVFTGVLTHCVKHTVWKPVLLALKATVTALLLQVLLPLPFQVLRFQERLVRDLFHAKKEPGTGLIGDNGGGGGGGG